MPQILTTLTLLARATGQTAACSVASRHRTEPHELFSKFPVLSEQLKP